MPSLSFAALSGQAVYRTSSSQEEGYAAGSILGYTYNFMAEKRWAIYYAASLIISTWILTGVALRRLPLDRSLQYDILLAGLSAFILLLPSLILLCLTHSKPQRFLLRSLGQALLAWLLLIDIHILVLTVPPNGSGGELVYVFDIAIGFWLIKAFRLPYSFAILAVVFPGLSLLYFLVVGQMRDREGKIEPPRQQSSHV
jgi:hypothetical protein